METKNIFKSKTFWANALVIGIALANYVAGYFGVTSDQSTVDPGGLAMFLGALNIVLRLLTKQPTSVK